MKKVIKLTESDLIELISKVISEQKTFGEPSTTYVKNNPMSSPKYMEYDKTMRNCKSIFSQSVLNKAINWWNNWLSSNVTKQKFAKNHNIDLVKTNEIFKNYKEILNGCVLEYTREPSDNSIAYVKAKPIIKILPSLSDKKVYVNCEYAKNIDTTQSLGILVHELQHKLNNYYPIHPDSKVLKDFNIENQKISNEIKSLFSNVNKNKNVLNTTKYVKKLTDQGIQTSKASDIVYNYTYNLINDNIDYVVDANEMLSRIEGLRALMNKKPGENISLQDIINTENIETDANFLWLMGAILFSGKNIKDILNLINTYAVNNQNKFDNIA